MARSRNIKPSFFMNEDIVELSIEARLLFIGLWTLADREGRLENRPKKIKMSLFPADEINVSELLLNISKYGFIQLYNVDDLDVIQIVNFVKHQTPHGLEKDSELPDQNGLYTVYERNQKNKTVTGKPKLVTKSELSDFYNKTGAFSANVDVNNSFNDSNIGTQNNVVNNNEQDNNSYETVSISDKNALNPESFNLNPESFNKNICPPNGEPAPEKPKFKKNQNSYSEDFEKFWTEYPRCKRKSDKSGAFKTFEKHKSNFDLDFLLQILRMQKADNQWIKQDGEFIPSPDVWLNQKQWENDYWTSIRVSEFSNNTSNQVDLSQYVLGEDRRYD